MNSTIWLLLVVMAILMWAATSLLYKAGVHGDKEEYICFKYSVCVGIVFYSYAMAINSVSTDPLIAIYPIFVMIGGRVIMKEKVSAAQVLLLLGIVTGSIMIVLDTVF